MAERSYESPDDKKRRTGVVFDMRGGPYDGMLLRLFPGRYAPLAYEDGGNYVVDSDYSTRYRGTEGWEELPCEGGRYVVGDGVNPLMDKKAPNKARSNVPFMEFEAGSASAPSDVALPVAA